MGVGVFNRCPALTSVSLPTTMATISVATFYLCSALRTVSFPSQTTTVSKFAFQDSGRNNWAMSVNPRSVGFKAFYNTPLEVNGMVDNCSVSGTRMLRGGEEGKGDEIVM
jgi:hypothetical protein